MSRLAFALVIVLAGCSSGTPARDTVLLTGSSWSVERIVSADGSVARGGGETIAFGADGSLSMASCNTCQGRYETSGNRLVIDEGLRCTRKACMADEVELERIVSGTQLVERDGPYLILTAEVEAGAPDPPRVILLPTEAPASAATN